jgi:hypothetical protein
MNVRSIAFGLTDEAVWLGSARAWPLADVTRAFCPPRDGLAVASLVANVGGRAAHQQVRLSIQKIGDPVAKQRMLFQDEDWCSRRILSLRGHCVGYA